MRRDARIAYSPTIGKAMTNVTIISPMIIMGTNGGNGYDRVFKKAFQKAKIDSGLLLRKETPFHEF